MKDEYVIINKTAIQKRIEELEEEKKKFNIMYKQDYTSNLKLDI